MPAIDATRPLETHGAWQRIAQPLRGDAGPRVYEINTRVWLKELETHLGRPATLDDIPDDQLDTLARNGFDCIWLLGVWQTGAAGQGVSRDNVSIRAEITSAMPDVGEDKICGSCFAVTCYSVHSDLGGDAALERLRRRLHQRHLRLLLDFVPNHTALDHPWSREHPEYYVSGIEEQLRREPYNYAAIETSQGRRVLAYGRDPYFHGWPDTLQLDYANPAVVNAMREELENVAQMCDGVRCDMAMLILPEVFERTWRRKSQPFWRPVIQGVRTKQPDFLFIAEAYWDLEWNLQQQGFDYTYDKRLYDRLRAGNGRPVRDHLSASTGFQRKCARFLENHDEPRAADAFKPEMHPAAAVLTYLTPGLRLFHEGQLEGRTKKISVHVNRRPTEDLNVALRAFYALLLGCLARPEVCAGDWRLLECRPAWDGNWTWDCFVAFAWQLSSMLPLVAVANYSGNHSQCYLPLPHAQLRGQLIVLEDLFTGRTYERDGNELIVRGLYLDMASWAFHVFRMTTIRPAR